MEPLDVIRYILNKVNSTLVSEVHIPRSPYSYTSNSFQAIICQEEIVETPIVSTLIKILCRVSTHLGPPSCT